MNKWFVGILSSFACLFMLSAVVVCMLAVMNAVSYSPAHLWKLLAAPPLALCGWLMLRYVDKSL